jgi:mycofactocin precursor
MRSDTTAADAAPTGVAGTETAEDALVEEDLLVEEVSIDGMCGVY